MARRYDLAPVDFIRVGEVEPDDAIARRHELFGRRAVHRQGAMHHAVLGGM